MKIVICFIAIVLQSFVIISCAPNPIDSGIDVIYSASNSTNSSFPKSCNLTISENIAPLAKPYNDTSGPIDLVYGGEQPVVFEPKTTPQGIKITPTVRLIDNKYYIYFEALYSFDKNNYNFVGPLYMTFATAELRDPQDFIDPIHQDNPSEASYNRLHPMELPEKNYFSFDLGATIDIQSMLNDPQEYIDILVDEINSNASLLPEEEEFILRANNATTNKQKKDILFDYLFVSTPEKGRYVTSIDSSDNFLSSFIISFYEGSFRKIPINTNETNNFTRTPSELNWTFRDIRYIKEYNSDILINNIDTEELNHDDTLDIIYKSGITVFFDTKLSPTKVNITPNVTIKNNKYHITFDVGPYALAEDPSYGQFFRGPFRPEAIEIEYLDLKKGSQEKQYNHIELSYETSYIEQVVPRPGYPGDLYFDTNVEFDLDKMLIGSADQLVSSLTNKLTGSLEIQLDSTDKLLYSFTLKGIYDVLFYSTPFENADLKKTSNPKDISWNIDDINYLDKQQANKIGIAPGDGITLNDIQTMKENDITSLIRGLNVENNDFSNRIKRTPPDTVDANTLEELLFVLIKLKSTLLDIKSDSKNKLGIEELDNIDYDGIDIFISNLDDIKKVLVLCILAKIKNKSEAEIKRMLSLVVNRLNVAIVALTEFEFICINDFGTISRDALNLYLKYINDMSFYLNHYVTSSYLATNPPQPPNIFQELAQCVPGNYTNSIVPSSGADAVKKLCLQYSIVSTEPLAPTPEEPQNRVSRIGPDGEPIAGTSGAQNAGNVEQQCLDSDSSDDQRCPDIDDDPDADTDTDVHDELKH